MRQRKLGWCGYATIYRMLIDRPWTAIDLAEQLGITAQSACRVLDRMRDVGFAHRCEWVRPKPHSKEVAVFSAGEGAEPQTPKHHKGRARSKNNALPELVAAMQILRLMRSPISRGELREQCGASHVNLRRLIAHCRDIGLVRIADWSTETPGIPVALFCIGEGPDAPRPQPKPRSLINRQNRMGRIARQQQMTILRALAAVDHREAA